MVSRRCPQIDGPQGPRVVVEGRAALHLCSNNYLGLADDPRVAAAAGEAAARWGAGAGASRLVAGDMEPHRLLEQRLAGFKRYPAALLFGSGYLANLGVIGALVGRGEVVFSDALNHASIVDGCRLSRAQTFIYRHADLDHLAWGLARAGGRAALVVSDGVFSMDGDIAPVAELLELSRRNGVRLMVDEAHATGAVGAGGRGSVAAAGLEGEVDVVVGTLGKALGSYGAFVCAAAATIELLVNRARTLIFSTALPPATVAAATAALEVLVAEPARVEKLAANASVLRTALASEGFASPRSSTQIVPLVIGDAEPTMKLSERCLEYGVYAQGIRPPSVPEGTSRLRFTVMASHSTQELEWAAGLAGTAARELDLLR